MSLGNYKPVSSYSSDPPYLARGRTLSAPIAIGSLQVAPSRNLGQDQCAFSRSQHLSPRIRPQHGLAHVASFIQSP